MTLLDIKPYPCLKSSQDIKKWYEENYHLLSLSGLWLKGGEPNTMDAALFTQAELRFLVCRLSTYRDVSVSISHSLIAQIAQEVKGVFVDFAFLPPPKDMEIMNDSKIPLWLGITTKEPACAFDILGISNSFVLELLNLPGLLHFSGIPIFKNKRMIRPDIPLIILGGANAAVTSVLHGPIKDQGFENNYGLVDAVIIGEGEHAIKQFLEIVKEGKSLGLSKAEILNSCHGKVDGFYEPDKYEHQYTMIVQNYSEQELGEKTGSEQVEKPSPSSSLCEKETKIPLSNEKGLVGIVPREPYVSYPVKGAIVYNLDQTKTMESCPLWYDPESLGTGSLQISNGCPCFCAFCAESWERKPYRERSLPKLLEGLRSAKAHQGLDTVNLLSFNFNTHEELYPMVLSFYEETANISLKSQRFDLLSTDRFLVEVLQIIGKTTVSCGMEGISERLRRYLHKNLTEEQVYKACEFLFERGIRELKIFLISTGLEQEEDFLEFEKFVKRLADLKSMCRSNVRSIFSLTPLYYSPHTPLEFHTCITVLEDTKKIRKKVEHICKLHGMEFRESASHEESWLTQLLAMGDRRLTPALVRSSITDGFTYYNNIPNQIIKTWRTYLTELGLSEGHYFRAKGKDHIFPWDDIDLGVSKKFLWEEYERSIHFRERDYCLGRPQVEAQCLGCGACPTGAQIKKITRHKASQPFLLEELHRISESKRNRIIVRLIAEIEPSMRLVPKRFIGIAVARALMLAIPDVVPYYHSLSGHLRDFDGDKVTTDFTYGINVYDLAFLSKERIGELLNYESLSQKLADIQQHCRGFRIKEFVLNRGNILDVKYILYRVHWNTDFTRSFIEQKMGEYLHAHYVKHTLLKRKDRTIFKVNAKNKKNAVVLYTEINTTSPLEKSDAEFSVFMIVAKRFDIQTFLETFYGFGRRRELIRTKIEALGYYGKYPDLQKSIRCISCGDYIQETFLAGQPFIEHHCLMCSIKSEYISQYQ
ncbi:MAG: radical SAM protein [Candidatus Jettenia caeni]|nr:radical SAM protein [Candidatus Jettenia caeni]